MESFLTWSWVGRLSSLCWDSFTTFISWFENQLSSDRLVQPTNTNRETDFTDLLPFFFYKITKTAGNYLLLWKQTPLLSRQAGLQTENLTTGIWIWGFFSVWQVFIPSAPWCCCGCLVTDCIIVIIVVTVTLYRSDNQTPQYWVG